MANTLQARKRARQAEKHRQHNASQRNMMRTYIKNVIKAVEAGDKEGAVSSFKKAAPMIDRTANKGLIHKNKAARHKRSLNTRIKALS